MGMAIDGRAGQTLARPPTRCSSQNLAREARAKAFARNAAALAVARPAARGLDTQSACGLRCPSLVNAPGHARRPLPTCTCAENCHDEHARVRHEAWRPPPVHATGARPLALCRLLGRTACTGATSLPPGVEEEVLPNGAGETQLVRRGAGTEVGGLGVPGGLVVMQTANAHEDLGREVAAHQVLGKALVLPVLQADDGRQGQEVRDIADLLDDPRQRRGEVAMDLAGEHLAALEALRRWGDRQAPLLPAR
mmetsp:Transcript_72035/g.220491  ORF Transcript_72035/g.220491 Transcript_72035/m.220491 type:complete len:251 (-) Transcript_72035:498-1250(-)